MSLSAGSADAEGSADVRGSTGVGGSTIVENSAVVSIGVTDTHRTTYRGTGF